MDIDTAPVNQSYTILRIKRKRTEEPLDALVVESRLRRKKSRGGVGVFQFAQTVEQDTWEDEQRRKDLQDQISRLARETALKAGNASASPIPTAPPSPSLSRQKDDMNRRYTIIEHETLEADKPKQPISPPKVISAKDVLPKTNASDFKMYDAVLSTNAEPAPPVDEDMEKFMPMLNDYLKLHDDAPLASPKSSPVVSGRSGVISSASQDDYVYDVFYHRPVTLSEWNEAANVGTLTGLPPSFTDPYDSASDSEEEDEADEDSNAEEYYKNDYPEEEDHPSDSDSSDAFHEDSDQEDLTNYDDDGDDHEWR